MKASTKRMRVFAGPNGSGKSTLFKLISQQYPIGVYVNADLIEFHLANAGFINLLDFSLETSLFEFETFLAQSTLSQKAPGQKLRLHYQDNVVVRETAERLAYEAAFLADFIRHCLLKRHQSFSFETVMSHSSKVEYFSLANQASYKTYLYFVCTEDPEINLARVKNRIGKGGHDVPEDKIVSRYFKSIELLPKAIASAYRSFIFDNSGNQAKLILEFKEGQLLQDFTVERPNWVKKNLPFLP
jgi:predicted ABC-type ATPase